MAVDDELDADFECLCEHEAAHAVMRWHLGLGGTELLVDEEELEGSNSVSNFLMEARESLLIALAGWAWNDGYGNWNTERQLEYATDFKNAREIIAARPFLRSHTEISRRRGKPVVSLKTETVEETLMRFHKEAQGILWPGYEDLIPRLAARLARKKRLSGRQVDIFILDWVWNRNVTRLKEFTDKHGRFPRTSVPTEEWLCGWCDRQRQAKQRGRLSRRRQELLEGVRGWRWRGAWGPVRKAHRRD